MVALVVALTSALALARPGVAAAAPPITEVTQVVATAPGSLTTGATRTRTVRRRVLIGDRWVAVTVRLAGRGCVAHASALHVRLRTSRLGGRVIRGHVRDVRLYLDRGVAQVRLLRRHGHRTRVVTHAPNATVRELPATRSLRVGRLRHGRHTLRITVDGTQSVHRDGPRDSRAVSRTARVRFRVC